MEKSGPPPYGDLDLGPGIIASTTVLVAVSAIVVALRVATRWWIVKSIGWDDITIVLAVMRLRTKIGLSMLMGLGVITGACCIVRTVLNYQSIPKDLTYGGIDNWYWRLFEVQLGIIAACIPALRPGYTWTRTKVYSYISSRTPSNFTRFSKEAPPPQHLEEVKQARHLKAHPANTYSDPPMMLGSDPSRTVVASLGSGGDLAVQQMWRSTQFDVESQREPGQGVDSVVEEAESKIRPSLEVDLRPRFGLDRVDQSLERIDPELLRTMDDGRRHQMKKGFS
ncbi:MAG: hypothetical protein LQ350_001001 [Teloschistes chrysophthalmus]|nr:MAG: hypothetical protein LQ350_001001 [Niorma chrysophthalma]